MTDQLIGAHNAHNELHSEQGARPGEHPGRSANPIIKVHDVLWLEFEKPDLVKAEAFAHSFGFATVLRTNDELHLRGSDAGAPCVLIRRGAREKFLGPAFVASEQSDLVRLADATGTSVRPLPESPDHTEFAGGWSCRCHLVRAAQPVHLPLSRSSDL